MLDQRSLKLHPPQVGSVLMCANPTSAYEHLCDHLLTRPEAHYWAALLPAYGDYLDPENDKALFAFARRLWSEGYQGRAVAGEQPLYDGFADSTQSALNEAMGQQWCWEEESCRGWIAWHGLGKCGVYVIWDRTAVRTAMLLGFAAPPPESQPSPEERIHNPLPRQNAWKYRGSELRQDDTRYPAVPDGSGPDEKLRYFLFRRSLSRFRREYRNARRESDRRQDGRWSGDTRIVTPLSESLERCDFATWRQLSAGSPVS